MAQSTEEILLEIIKKDDIKAFDAMMEKTQCGAYRLGRFPVLSLMYLYKSRKMISAYEAMFMQITNFKVLSEPLDVSGRFSAKAGKCLRLYFNEVVSPLEMLLILNNTKRLKQVYPMTMPSPAIKGRLKSIYYIKYSLSVKFEGNDIILERRPLSNQEKKKIATICLCLILSVLLAVGTPITVVSLMPKPIEGEVTKLKHIDFASNKEYTLKKDIVLPKNYSVDEVNCTITGEGHKLIFGDGATLGVLNGKLSDMTIESGGDALFSSISANASIENVTVNVNADISTTESTAFVALNNYGVIDGVNVNVKGKINALATSQDVTEELTFGGLVLENNAINNNSIGTVKNCNINYSQFSLAGETSANAVFGGVAGINNGYLQDCKVSGEIVADTFDLAGVCCINNGLLSDNINEAKLTQTSVHTTWNPIVCGIVMRNSYVVESCQNNGDISAVSDCANTDNQEENMPTVSAGGIAYINSGGIEKCKSRGAITVAGLGEAYVGGISAHSYSRISYCLSSGEVNATAKKVYAGGILGSSELTTSGYLVYFGATESCISQSKIRVAIIGDGQAYVGGIAGYVREIGFENGNSTMYFGGRVFNCYFTGECLSDISYFGNIVGVCGANVYQSNSYTSNGVEYYNFDGNYYLDNSSSAFGATVTDDDNFAVAEDKGATSATLEYIQNTEIYKLILKNLNI